MRRYATLGDREGVIELFHRRNRRGVAHVGKVELPLHQRCVPVCFARLGGAAIRCKPASTTGAATSASAAASAAATAA
eukprot:5633665-Pyramimonas_sp.AAC.1